MDDYDKYVIQDVEEKLYHIKKCNEQLNNLDKDTVIIGDILELSIKEVIEEIKEKIERKIKFFSPIVVDYFLKKKKEDPLIDEVMDTDMLLDIRNKNERI